MIIKINVKMTLWFHLMKWTERIGLRCIAIWLLNRNPILGRGKIGKNEFCITGLDVIKRIE